TAGAPISSSRPMPVTIVEGQKGGAWDQLLRSIETYLGLPRGILGGQGGPGGEAGEAGGGGIRARSVGGAPTGKEADLAKQGYDYLISQGASPDVAIAILGNARGENQLGSLAIGGSGEMGQFQWKEDRRQRILAATGIDVRTAGFQDQLKAFLWEAKNSPNDTNRIWDRLVAAKTDDERMLILVHEFEQSGNQMSDRAIRMGHAERYRRLIYGGASGGTSWNASVGDIPPDLLAKIKAENPDLSPHQCVQLAQAVMGVGNVHSWFRGAGEKDLPEEVALATFGYHGESDRYALGGSGTPGINRDHSLIRVKKYPDGSFDAISQDASHPPHLVHIPWTGKGGEGDASSYYGISHAARVSQALPPTGARLAMRQPRPVVHRNLAIASIRVETHAHDAHAIAADVRLAVEREMKSVA